MINRAALILKYKAPAVQWINDADPGISLESVHEESTVYLIRDQDADNPEVFKKWVELNDEVLFEHELDGWYTDESLWPKVLNLKLFHEWFDIECHTMILNTVGFPIEDDEI